MLFKRAYMNIRDDFCESKDMRFKSSPIGKILMVISDSFNVTGRHYNKYWMIIDILEKNSVDFDKCEVLIEGYFF